MRRILSTLCDRRPDNYFETINPLCPSRFGSISMLTVLSCRRRPLGRRVANATNPRASRRASCQWPRAIAVNGGHLPWHFTGFARYQATVDLFMQVRAVEKIALVICNTSNNTAGRVSPDTQGTTDTCSYCLVRVSGLLTPNARQLSDR